MKKWSLNFKIIVILSIFTMGSIVIAVTGSIGMGNLNTALANIVSGNANRLDKAHELKTLFTLLALNEKNYILEDTKEGMTTYRKKFEGYDADLMFRIQELRGIASAQGKIDMDEFKETYEKWRAIDEEVMKSGWAEDNKTAFTLSTTTGKAQREKAEEIIGRVVTRNQQIMKDETVKASELYINLRNSMAAISFMAIAIGLTFAFFVMKAVSVAIDQVILNLTDSSGQVTSAAHQIAASSEELSSSVTEQAASLEETASSIEELNSMVQKNAENAVKTSSLAGDSRDSANKGKHVVQDMVNAIDDINTSNKSIMDSITESNQKISQIVNVISEIGNKTKVINDIVFQTKLLSFNASVEAARAGEQGKGFAVVAEEIGTLAEMSGKSAKEITEMLDESIHKVEGIVLETKQKVERLVLDGKLKVETGTRIAKDCDNVLSEIVVNVSNVTSMANEISNACQEQALGVHEITKAIGVLDQVTQNNAAASEEAAGAAEELSGQAESLRSVIGILVQTIKGSAAAGVQVAVVSTPSNNVVAMRSKKVVKTSADFIKKTSRMPEGDDVRFKEV